MVRILAVLYRYIAMMNEHFIRLEQSVAAVIGKKPIQTIKNVKPLSNGLNLYKSNINKRGTR